MELAKQLDARLEAFVLEDDQLRRAASLSFSCETGLTSAKTRSLDPAELERQFQAGRIVTERLLSEAGRRYAVEWSLSIQTGPLSDSEQLMEAERTADWLAVSESCIRGAGSVWQKLLGSGLTTREVFVLRQRQSKYARSGRTAVLAFGELPENAIELARQFALKLHSPDQLALFLTPAVESPLLGAGDVVFRIPSGLRDIGQLLGQLRESGATAIIAIASQSSPAIDHVALESLVALSTLPIAVLTTET
ncbi:MAG: hypothetical protein ACI8UO_002150 [Verrucomicrobiales bacterium]|jgi:hypothetical protein